MAASCGRAGVALILWLCISSIVPITGSLQPSRERSSPSAISDSNEASKLDSLDVSAKRSPWELPIIEETTRDVPRSEDKIIEQREGEMGDGGKEVKEKGVKCKFRCFRADPVCGEDAITYWCGAAEAECAGVKVDYTGYCDSRSGGVVGDGTRAGQSLLLVHLVWLVFAGFLVMGDFL